MPDLGQSHHHFGGPPNDVTDPLYPALVGTGQGACVRKNFQFKKFTKRSMIVGINSEDEIT